MRYVSDQEDDEFIKKEKEKREKYHDKKYWTTLYSTLYIGTI